MELELPIQKLDRRGDGYVVFGPPAQKDVTTDRFFHPRPKLTLDPDTWELLGCPTALKVELTPTMQAEGVLA